MDGFCVNAKFLRNGVFLKNESLEILFVDPANLEKGDVPWMRDILGSKREEASVKTFDIGEDKGLFPEEPRLYAYSSW